MVPCITCLSKLLASSSASSMVGCEWATGDWWRRRPLGGVFLISIAEPWEFPTATHYIMHMQHTQPSSSNWKERGGPKQRKAQKSGTSVRCYRYGEQMMRSRRHLGRKHDCLLTMVKNRMHQEKFKAYSQLCRVMGMLRWSKGRSIANWCGNDGTQPQ